MAQHLVIYNPELNKWPNADTSTAKVWKTTRHKYFLAPALGIGTGSTPCLYRQVGSLRKIIAVVPELYREPIRAVVHATNCWRNVITNIPWPTSIDTLWHARSKAKRRLVVKLSNILIGAVQKLICAQEVLEEAHGSCAILDATQPHKTGTSPQSLPL